MPRRYFETWYYHIYNRWFDKKIIFKNDIDFERFYKTIIKNLAVYENIKIISYCLIPNHFHLILDYTESTPGLNDMSKFMWNIQNWYWKYFNLKYEIKWAVFEWRFKAKLINDNDYLDKCIAYVNFNSLKHEIVDNINEYRWTSYHQIDKKKIDQFKDLFLGELEM